MDWSNVTPAELVDALREVDWLAPRPVWECVSRFSIPKSRAKWGARAKCNVYYYRTNYLAVLTLALGLGLARTPLAAAGAAALLLAALSFNDPFAAALNDAVVRLLRRAHPHAASLLRSRCTASAPGLATSRQRAQNVRVLGLPRPLFTALLCALTVFCWLRSRAWLRLLLSLAAGIAVPAAHATLRSPNLKARLASAREEFRAVWRGYQADIAHQHDYTL